MKKVRRTMAVAAAAAMMAVPYTASAEEVTYPMEIECSDGSVVTIDKEPQKVVSMGPNMTEIIYAIGAGDKLAGRTDYCDYPAEVSEVESVGTISNADIEKILSLEPDLVIASTHFSEESIAQLNDAGVNVLYLYSADDFEGVFDSIKIVGEALNCTEGAQEVMELMQDKLDYVKNTELPEDKLSVYYVVGFGEYGDYTAGGDTFINGILEAAGAENIAADVQGWSYSAETLLDKDPYAVLLAAYNYDDFTGTEPYSKLTAVAEDRVYTIDTNMLDRQGPRNADAVLKVSELLYPECYPAQTEYPLTIEDTVIEEAPVKAGVMDEELKKAAERLSSDAEIVMGDADALAEEKPDVVFAADLSEDDAKKLEEAGIKVVAVDPENMAETSETMGKVLNAAAAAEAIAAFYEN